ncbi:hypothetical protein ACIG3E_32715 [Streptomyces sp. NPDC053474]|uniref:beta barrel domain-containing protein n=1 Tax=Streptomyces sp. NPDC053474 TaxID=3365704 RepID=UPI0037D3E5BD
MSESELTPVRVGDSVMVIDRYGTGSHEPVRALVTKAPRIWLEMTEAEPRAGRTPLTWRLRRDTQDDGGGRHNRPRFLTSAQHAREQRRTSVDAYLAGAGIRTEHGTLWHTPENRLVLANLLRAHEGLPPL